MKTKPPLPTGKCCRLRACFMLYNTYDNNTCCLHAATAPACLHAALSCPAIVCACCCNALYPRTAPAHFMCMLHARLHSWSSMQRACAMRPAAAIAVAGHALVRSPHPYPAALYWLCNVMYHNRSSAATLAFHHQLCVLGRYRLVALTGALPLLQ